MLFGLEITSEVTCCLASWLENRRRIKKKKKTLSWSILCIEERN